MLSIYMEEIITTIMITPGAKPKVTISASESNCLPNSPAIFIFLARYPSRKSHRSPIKTANGAKSILPDKANMIAIQPLSKFAAVNRLGILNIRRPEMLLFIMNFRSIELFLRLVAYLQCTKNTIFC